MAWGDDDGAADSLVLAVAIMAARNTDIVGDKQDDPMASDDPRQFGLTLLLPQLPGLVRIDSPSAVSSCSARSARSAGEKNKTLCLEEKKSGKFERDGRKRFNAERFLSKLIIT